MQETIIAIAQLGGTVFVTCAFLYYLYIKNGRIEKAQEKMFKQLETQTRVLIKIARVHDLEEDAEDLMTGK